MIETGERDMAKQDTLTTWFERQCAENGGKRPRHLDAATSLTKFGYRNMSNRKPFRTQYQKRIVAATHLAQEEGRITRDELRRVCAVTCSFHRAVDDRSHKH